MSFCGQIDDLDYIYLRVQYIGKEEVKRDKKAGKIWHRLETM